MVIYASGSRKGGDGFKAGKFDPNGANEFIDLTELFLPGGRTNNPFRQYSKAYEVGSKLSDRLSVNPLLSIPVDSFCNSCGGKPHNGLPYRRTNAVGNVIDTIRR